MAVGLPVARNLSEVGATLLEPASVPKPYKHPLL